jgi:hypothetical protein
MKTGNFFTETALFYFFWELDPAGSPRLTIPEDRVRPVSR